MLSYRHAFHAGNHADVLKHGLLCSVLEYMGLKEKGFLYLDTHAGSGPYSLTDARALKIAEFNNGIERLWRAQQMPQALRPYLDCVTHFNPDGNLTSYPGSPAIALTMLRQQDRAELFELHSSDAEALRNFCRARTNCRVNHADGFAAVKALLPPIQKRALVLIDPPYEIKTDYAKVIETLAQGYKRFPGGVFMLWYPVVWRAQVDELVKGFTRLKVSKALQIESCIAPDSAEQGMTGSGMLIINPPWTLAARWQEVLPFLTGLLGGEGAYWQLRDLSHSRA